MTPIKTTTDLRTPRAKFAKPTRICAATSSKRLSLAHEWRGSAMRPGAFDFLKCPTRGAQ